MIAYRDFMEKSHDVVGALNLSRSTNMGRYMSSLVENRANILGQ
jgi:hypothetical protein